MTGTAAATSEDTEPPFVTVITPTFNSPDRLKTIESVLRQDYPSMEYIVIDDGSEVFDPGDIEELAERLGKRDVLRVMANDTNIGTVRTLNRAIGESKGKYIFNIGADDVFNDDSVISDWVREFESTGALVITAKRDIRAPGLGAHYRIAPSKKIIRTIEQSTPQELFRAMYGSNMIVGCCTAQSRRCFDEYGLYDERYRIIEDYPRYLYLSREGVPIHFMDRVVVKYSSGGISSQARFNEVYEKESDAIFENEVLKFADDREKAEKMYSGWKARTVLRRDFLQRYCSAKGAFGRFVHWVGYAFRDPTMAAQFMQERIRGGKG